jgi:hypothetical protein
VNVVTHCLNLLMECLGYHENRTLDMFVLGQVDNTR